MRGFAVNGAGGRKMSNTIPNCLFLLPKEEINSREDGGMLYSRTHTHTLDARTCFPVLSLLCRQVNLISPRDLDAITPPTPGRHTLAGTHTSPLIHVIPRKARLYSGVKF